MRYTTTSTYLHTWDAMDLEALADIEDYDYIEINVNDEDYVSSIWGYVDDVATDFGIEYQAYEGYNEEVRNNSYDVTIEED